MAAYFSPEWCQAAAKVFNDDPDAPDALEGWKGDVGLFVDEVGVWLAAPVNERLGDPVLMTAQALEAKGVQSMARASLATWGELIAGRLDPIAAIVQKRLEVRGDLQQIVSRMGYRGLAERWLLAVREGV